ncbi:MAG: hypothetical protein ACYTJ0_04310, partial [Planctomycetota bacterium]
MSRSHSRVTSSVTTLVAGMLALAVVHASGDVVVDEFSHTGLFSEPWPFEQTSSGGAFFAEVVEAGTIEGEMDRVRETDVHSTMFQAPGTDVAVMGVDTGLESFTYVSTDGVGNMVAFGYSYVIMNPLHADLSAERGLRIDLTELELGVEPFIRCRGRLIGGVPPFI